MPKIDFTGVGQPVPADDYAAVVTKAEYNPSSKNSGNPVVAIEWTISEGAYEGRKMFRSYSVQPNALVFLKRVLVALSVDPEDLSAEIDLDSVLEDIIGNDCILVVTETEYNGSPSNSVENVKQTGVAAF